MEEATNKHLRVYTDRSELYQGDTKITTFYEGSMSESAKKRLSDVKNKLETGYLENLIANIENNYVPDFNKISKVASESIGKLIGSVTSEVGRALIGLSVMQLCIKSISPEQSVRLHKGSSNRNSFSWKEGISMRSLDKTYVTPILRKYELLRLNKDGFMMTRSLAENYPYSDLYKAQLKGARLEWLALVEEIEQNKTDAHESLKYIVNRLFQETERFKTAAEKFIGNIDLLLKKTITRKNALQLLLKHSADSDYAARLLEINMHSLMQSCKNLDVFPEYELKPLSQMRSANKKHGNVGDIELYEGKEIIESWDAKFGKGYLREEIEEAYEKIENHPSIQTVGFVTTVGIERSKEVNKRISELKEITDIDFKIMTLDDWVKEIFDRSAISQGLNEEKLAKEWVKTYSEYLALKRRDQAPIDEPTIKWIQNFSRIVEKNT